MTVSIKSQSVKAVLQSVMGIGCAVLVADKIDVEIVTWDILKAVLVDSDWNESAIEKALIQFNYNAY